MCGLVGWFGPAGSEAPLDRLAAAAKTLAARGPDAEGHWSAPGVGFAHRRLSILDLSPAGSQPMTSASGRCTIVHNGEVYDYEAVRRAVPEVAWRGHSDTEAIVEAYESWGADCLSRFNGMFAFAIHDRASGQLFVARDRLGVKPLFYGWLPRERVLVFGSRPRALLALAPELGARLSPDALRSYVEAGYIPAPLSIYSGMAKLKPGHFLRARPGMPPEVVCYWNPALLVPDPSTEGADEATLLDELDALTDDALRLRMISDVPLGAFLSGGIDSGLVVAKLARLSSTPVRAFTIGFDAPGFDETAAAASIATRAGVVHTVESLRMEDLLGLVEPFFAEFDEPLADSSAFPTMAVARLARKSVTVALSGDGGDELFAGYHYHRLASRLAVAFRWPSAARRIAAAMAARLGGHRGALLAGALRREDLARAYAYSRGVQKDFGAAFRWEAPEPSSHEQYIAEVVADFARPLDPVSMAAATDLRTILPGDYLYKVDGATMACSLEAREPWLDYRLVEWAARLTPSWKVRAGRGKYLWRQLARRYLPPPVIDAPKRGFEVPVAEWLRGPLEGWARQRLDDSALYDALPLRREHVGRVFLEHRAGLRNAAPFLWSLVVLAEFLARKRQGHA